VAHYGAHVGLATELAGFEQNISVTAIALSFRKPVMITGLPANGAIK
jgi:hypothetical protein